MTSPGSEKIIELQNAILDVQKKQDVNEAARSKAASVLADVKKEITSIESAAPVNNSAEIEVKRRRLAADVALKLKSQADADAFEKEVAKAQKVFESQAARLEALGPLRTTAKGLEERVTELEAERVALATEHRSALLAYFKDGVAEARGASVKEHGAIVRDNVAALAAVGSILFHLQGADGGVGRAFRDLRIPSLGTLSTALPYRDRFDKVFSSDDLFTLGSDDAGGRFVDTAQAALIDAAEAAGIRCPANIRPAAEKPVIPSVVPEPAAVNSAEKPGDGILTVIAAPRRVPPGAAQPRDPKNPDALRGPVGVLDGLPTRAITAEVD